MRIIQNIITDYEKLIKTQFSIPLVDGDIIKFMFHPWDLPHLLGLQYLVDIPELFEYRQGRLSAKKLYKGMCNRTYDIDSYEHSTYFPDLYKSRIKYFTSDTLLNIIDSCQIIKFNPRKLKNFSTRMEKLEYIFWKEIRDEHNNYGYFGIGFMATGKSTDENYPNTFFFRSDNQYVTNQKPAIAASLLTINPKKERSFRIYWSNIRKSMNQNPHYKFLKSYPALWKNGTLDPHLIQSCQNEDVKHHFKLLQLDELNKAYLPYMEPEFRWTNAEKEYLVDQLSEHAKDLLPGELKMLLNTYRQLHMH
ncbi:PBECR4 domain-containing protein [Blautia schinkii]|nr:PBECR4 domain-containing protein [Blautia schinkii]